MEDTTITDKDVYWDMQWGDKYPDKPAVERMFEEGPALARLLAAEVVFLNAFWWKKDWPEDARAVTALCVNCSDIFAWGCSDGEEVTYEELQDLYDHWHKDPSYEILQADRIRSVLGPGYAEMVAIWGEECDTQEKAEQAVRRLFVL